MILTLCARKGGVGKSTLAAQLAMLRAHAGRDVILVDADTQGSSAATIAARQDRTELPQVAVAQVHGRALIQQVRDFAARYQDVVIDTPGRDAAELRASLLVADVAVVPTQALGYDVWTLEDVAGIVEEARALNEGLRALLVLNRVSTNPRLHETREVLSFVDEYPALTWSGVIIRDRIAIARGTVEGCCVLEMERADLKAAGELKALYKAVFEEELTYA